MSFPNGLELFRVLMKDIDFVYSLLYNFQTSNLCGTEIVVKGGVEILWILNLW